MPELPTDADLRHWEDLAAYHITNHPLPVPQTEQGAAIAELARAVPHLLKLIEHERQHQAHSFDQHLATLPVPVKGVPK